MNLLGLFRRRRLTAAEQHTEAMASFRAQNALRAQLQADARHRQIVALCELGGFDTMFHNDAKNEARQAEILLDLTRRVEALEKATQESKE